MANHASALKAIRSSQRRHAINKNRLSRMKTLVKKVHEASAGSSSQELSKAFRLAQADVMRNVSKGLLHKKTAARRISKLARRYKPVT